MSHLLVVAPELDLRQSLHFALEAEGYRVRSSEHIDWVSLAGQTFDCAVLDQHAAERNAPETVDFCARFAPVILLANTVPHALSEHASRTVLKPLLGAALAAAIRDVLEDTGEP